jgi:hypothetical protein
MVFLLKLTPEDVADFVPKGVTEGEGWNLAAWRGIIRGLPSMLLCGDKLEFPDDL